MQLADFLRHVLHAYGTHVGCEHGICGACTVLLTGARCARAFSMPCRSRAATSKRSRVSTAASRAQRSAGRFPPPPRAAMRLLHARHPDVGTNSCPSIRGRLNTRCARCCRATSAAAPAIAASSMRSSTPRGNAPASRKHRERTRERKGNAMDYPQNLDGLRWEKDAAAKAGY